MPGLCHQAWAQAPAWVAPRPTGSTRVRRVSNCSWPARDRIDGGNEALGQLFDTHALLWWLLDYPATPAAPCGAIEHAGAVFVGTASVWEIAIIK